MKRKLSVILLSCMVLGCTPNILTTVYGEEPTVMKNDYSATKEDFLQDIADSFKARVAFNKEIDNTKYKAMSEEERAYYFCDCAEKEKGLIEKYTGATFEDLNLQYLCEQYLKGVQVQIDSREIWDDTNSWDKFYDKYNAGYNMRSAVIIELVDYFKASFGDVSTIRKDVEKNNALTTTEKVNTTVDKEKIKKTQILLNDIGFFCGTADGICGKNTLKSIKRFQEMYAYEPIDGKIDDELIEQLQIECEKKGIEIETEEKK